MLCGLLFSAYLFRVLWVEIGKLLRRNGIEHRVILSQTEHLVGFAILYDLKEIILAVYSLVDKLKLTEQLSDLFF